MSTPISDPAFRYDSPEGREHLRRVWTEELRNAEHMLAVDERIGRSTDYARGEVEMNVNRLAGVDGIECPDCGIVKRDDVRHTAEGSQHTCGKPVYVAGQVPKPDPTEGYCRGCRSFVTGTLRADSAPPHFLRHYIKAGPDKGMACGPVRTDVEYMLEKYGDVSADYMEETA